MLGRRTSMPYTVCPVTLSGTSRFFCSVPMSVHRSGGLMVIVSGCGCGLGAGQLQVVAAVLHRRGGVGAHAPIEAVRNPGDAGSIASAEGRHAAARRIGRAVARDLERPRGRLLARVAVGRGVLGTDLRPVALQFLA